MKKAHINLLTKSCRSLRQSQRTRPRASVYPHVSLPVQHIRDLPRSFSSGCAAPLRIAAVADHNVPSQNVENFSTIDLQDVGSRTNTLYNFKSLPVSCPGCGALAHEEDAKEPGYYTRTRKAVKTYLRAPKPFVADEQAILEPQEEDQSSVDRDTPSGVAAVSDANEVVAQPASIPVCDRCHYLVHDSRGVSIAHPSLQDLADTIAESPFNRNHVFHVLDAADFPMSLIPSLFNVLDLARPRTQNRRSQHSYSRKPSISFIITRSDLLGPTKEKVDSLMPYFRAVLRTALGRSGENMRLGNIHLVSAKRGWWTREIKDSIWERGGGNWMLGKFNVGKSNLFEVLFPKGSGERAPIYAELVRDLSQGFDQDIQPMSESSLLPPVQPETPFPTMPLVSNLPGTTASPIRLSFGARRGELIDLPGLARGNLEESVQQDHRLDLVMTHRPTVTQYNIKPGQSLLLGGGLVRITPIIPEADASTVMLAYPFIPLKPHVTATEKAVGTQLQQRESGIETIMAEDAGQNIKSAGIITLDTNVTKQRAGALLRAGVDVKQLPFEVFSTDLLIEGVGWIELVCQIRKRRHTPVTAVNSIDDVHIANGGDRDNLLLKETDFKPFSDQTPVVRDAISGRNLPQVEVFTPGGKHISQRQPLGAWELWAQGRRTRDKLNVRPKKSMKGVKKREKLLKRPAQAQGTT